MDRKIPYDRLVERVQELEKADAERKKAEEALREAEHGYRELLSRLPIGVYRNTPGPSGRFILANETIAKMFGYGSPEAFLQTRVSDLYADPAERESFSRQLLAQGSVERGVLRLKKRDGTPFWGSVTARVVRNPQGDIEYFDGIVENISERRSVERELRELNETMDLAQKMAGIGYWSYDVRSGKRIWSTQMYENFGLDPASGPPRMADIQNVFHPEDRLVYESHFARALQGRAYDQVARIQFPGGETRIVRTQGHPRRNAAGEVVGLFGTSQDITQRVIAETALRESEEKYRRIFENSVVGFFQSTPEGRFISVNTAFARMLQYDSPEEVVSEITDINTQYYVDVEDRRRYQRILQEQGYVENYEVQVKRRDGARIWVSSSTRAYFDDAGSVLRYEGVNVDITFRKRAEKEREALQEQLQQSQKFEAIGTLAGGVAHDFNNLLMGIQGRASLMAAGLEAGHPLLEHIDGIESYIRSATELTKQMLGFARGGKYEVKATDIQALVSASAGMFGRTRKEIRIHNRESSIPLVAEVERKQIEQVLLNLFVNAWQAMPDGGDLFIETAFARIDPLAGGPYPIEAGAYVIVSVTDTGTGMDESTRQRIFDPFFTTKEKERGTGLGLASAYGIVKNHGGMITVRSRVGVGSTFNIFLPASRKKPHRETVPDEGIRSGSETILLVDDEEMIVEVGKAMLEKLGYRVVAAKGGTEAIEVLRRVGDEIDLVLLDLIMPGMDGGKTFDRIRRIRPRLPVVLSSGYAIDGQAAEIMERGCNGFIQKPFTLSDLSRKVREILEQTGKP